MSDDIPTDWQPLTMLFPFARQTEMLMVDTAAASAIGYLTHSSHSSWQNT